MSEIRPSNLNRIKEQLEMIRIAEAKIDLLQDSEQDLIASLKIVNRSSYQAMQIIEQDIRER